jgi:protein-tyrosine-phosphatase
MTTTLSRAAELAESLYAVVTLEDQAARELADLLSRAAKHLDRFATALHAHADDLEDGDTKDDLEFEATTMQSLVEDADACAQQLREELLRHPELREPLR